MIAVIALGLVAQTTVTLPAEAGVRGVEITLGEIAEIRGATDTERERLSAFSLGYAPAPGYSRLLQRRLIERRLRTSFPQLALVLDGAGACRVVPLSETVQAERLISVAGAELRARLADVDAEAITVGQVPDLVVPAGEQPSSLRPVLKREELHAGRWSVPVEVLVDGTVYRTVWTTWQVDLYAVVPVVTRDVAAGEELGADAFERRRVKIASGVPGRGLSDAALAGAVAAHDLAPGEVLGEREVRRPMVVLKGDAVHLQVRKGAITARVAATALQPGAVGQRIRVANATSGQEMTATVLSRQLVQIDLGRPGGANREELR